jgi:hypothetical protein
LLWAARRMAVICGVRAEAGLSQHSTQHTPADSTDTWPITQPTQHTTAHSTPHKPPNTQHIAHHNKHHTGRDDRAYLQTRLTHGRSQHSEFRTQRCLSTPHSTSQHTSPADPTDTWSITPSPLMSACSWAGARCSLHSVRPGRVATVAVGAVRVDMTGAVAASLGVAVTGCVAAAANRWPMCCAAGQQLLYTTRKQSPSPE